MEKNRVQPPRLTSTPRPCRNSSNLLDNFNEVSPIFPVTNVARKTKSSIPQLVHNIRSSGAKTQVPVSTNNTGAQNKSEKILAQAQKSKEENKLQERINQDLGNDNLSKSQKGKRGTSNKQGNEEDILVKPQSASNTSQKPSAESSFTEEAPDKEDSPMKLQRVSKLSHKSSTLKSITEEALAKGIEDVPSSPPASIVHNERDIFKSPESAALDWHIPTATKNRISLKRKKSNFHTITKRAKKTILDTQENEESLFESPELPNLVELSSLCNKRQTYVLKKKPENSDIQEEHNESVVDGITPLPGLNQESASGNTSVKIIDESSKTTFYAKKLKSTKLSSENPSENVSVKIMEESSVKTYSAKNRKPVKLSQGTPSENVSVKIVEESSVKASAKKRKIVKLSKDAIDNIVPETKEKQTECEDHFGTNLPNAQVRKENKKSMKISKRQLKETVNTENKIESASLKKKVTASITEELADHNQRKQPLRERKRNINYQAMIQENCVKSNENDSKDIKSKRPRGRPKNKSVQNATDLDKENMYDKNVVAVVNELPKKSVRSANKQKGANAVAEILSAEAKNKTMKLKKQTENKGDELQTELEIIITPGRYNAGESSNKKTTKSVKDNTCANNPMILLETDTDSIKNALDICGESNNKQNEQCLETILQSRNSKNNIDSIEPVVKTNSKTQIKSKAKSKKKESQKMLDSSVLADKEVLKLAQSETCSIKTAKTIEDTTSPLEVRNKTKTTCEYGNAIEQIVDKVLSSGKTERNPDEENGNAEQKNNVTYLRKKQKAHDNDTGHIVAGTEPASDVPRGQRVQSETFHHNGTETHVRDLFGSKTPKKQELQPGVLAHTHLHISNFVMTGEVKLEPGAVLSKISTNTSYYLLEGTVQVKISKHTKTYSDKDVCRAFFIPRSIDGSIKNVENVPVKMVFTKFRG